MKGIKFDDLTAIVAIYYGEANVYQENLNSFLAISEELLLKGLEVSKDQKEACEAEQVKPMKKYKIDSEVPNSRTEQIVKETTYSSNEKGSSALALPKTSVLSTDFQELDETVKSMIETSLNMFQGKEKAHAKICKVCGKEGRRDDIKRQIETNHLEGVSFPCNLCGNILRSRKTLSTHISKKHKEH